MEHLQRPIIESRITVNEEPKTISKDEARPASNQRVYTGCLVVLLLATAFVVGGLLGGMAGGGLVLWATDVEVSSWWMTPTPTALPTPTPSPAPTLTPVPIPLTPTITPPPSPTSSIADVVSQVVPAVVTVVNQLAGVGNFGTTVDARILGSGIVIDRRGYIVTNYHVVEPIGPSREEGGALTVILTTGEALPARLVASDERQDLALLRVEDGDMPVINWGDSGRVRQGEWVVAIGSALGDFPNSVTVGIVSGVNRALELEDVTIEGLIQTDAAINKGNSGGPLVNLSGEVIGINTFIIREGRSSGVAEGIGFAIPSTLARDLTEEWIASDASLTGE
jgi:2-alkenal reductase